MCERIFMPLMENNVTQKDTTDSETDDKPIDYEKKWVDGGKMSKKTVKEVQKLID